MGALGERTVESRIQLADQYYALQNYEKAIEEYKRAFDALCQLFWEKDLRVATVASRMSDTLLRLNKNKDAIFYLEMAIRIRQNLLGENHVDVAALYEQTARLYSMKAETSLAVEFWGKAIAIYSLDKSSVEQLVKVYGAISNIRPPIEKALLYAEKALTLSKELYDKKDIRIARAQMTLAYLYDCQVAHCFTGFIGVMIYGFG